MAKSKKKNPHRVPATKADVQRAKTKAMDEAVSYAWAIMFTVMRDKFGFGAVRLRRMWDEVNKLSDAISGGYVAVKDLMETLESEAGITLSGGKKQEEKQ